MQKSSWIKNAPYSRDKVLTALTLAFLVLVAVLTILNVIANSSSAIEDECVSPAHLPAILTTSDNC